MQEITPLIQINEVGPRDGLQNETIMIPTATKIAFINALSDTGLTYIEATSFVSAKWIPQLADHEEVYEKIIKHAGIQYPVLIPNMKGMQEALRCGVKEIAVFTAASEAFTQKNTNCTIHESLSRMQDIIILAKEHHIPVRGYISCVIACPYVGNTDSSRVADMTHELIDKGCYEVSLGDTIGVGTPKETDRLLTSILNTIPSDKIAMHFHDTHHHALDNIKLSVEMGIRSFDSSVGGLGGCPYAAGASGNVATEAVITLLHHMGYETGVDLEKLKKVLAIITPLTS